MTDLIQRFEALVLENFLLRRNLRDAQEEIRESNEVLDRIDLEDYEAYLRDRVVEDEDA